MKTLKHGDLVKVIGAKWSEHRAGSVEGFNKERGRTGKVDPNGGPEVWLNAEPIVIDRIPRARPQRIPLAIGEVVRFEGYRGTYRVTLPGWCEGDACKLAKVGRKKTSGQFTNAPIVVRVDPLAGAIEMRARNTRIRQRAARLHGALKNFAAFYEEFLGPGDDLEGTRQYREAKALLAEIDGGES